MGRWALAGALLALFLAVAPGNGYYTGLACAWISFWVGWVAVRRREDRGWYRLFGATALTLSSFALLISGARFAATMAALGEMERLLRI